MGRMSLYVALAASAAAAGILLPATAATAGSNNVEVFPLSQVRRGQKGYGLTTMQGTTPERYDAILDLNLRSVFFCTQGAAPALRAARGKVVNLADLAGLQPWPGFAAHSVSKAGVVMLTKVLARSLAPQVTVNAIAPGAVLVPEEYDEEERQRLARATPLGRLGSPGDVVGAMLYLLEAGDFVTGEVLTVDGGRLLR